jgi:hypothetical protein
MSGMPLPRVGSLLEDVLSYCMEHPYQDSALVAEALLLRRTRHGDDTVTVTLEGDAPEIVSFSTELLDQVESDWLDITSIRHDGVLILDVLPQRLAYRPVYVGRGACEVVFRRVTA